MLRRTERNIVLNYISSHMSTSNLQTVKQFQIDVTDVLMRPRVENSVRALTQLKKSLCMQRFKVLALSTSRFDYIESKKTSKL